MRTAALLIAGLLAGCATSPNFKVISETPAGGEYAAWCGGSACVSQQNVADIAQQHCQHTGLNAQIASNQLVERDLMKGEHAYYRYNCVR